MGDIEQKLAELERVQRVSDLLCTAHSVRANEFHRKALAIDIAILILSAWLVAMAFVDPGIAALFAPLSIKPNVWVGILAFATFVLSLIQLRVDWKGQSEAHRRSCGFFADVKRSIGYLRSHSTYTDEVIREIFTRYDVACSASIAIEDCDFLRLKSKHKTKIEISKMLDDKPNMSIWLARIRLWLRDNGS